MGPRDQTEKAKALYSSDIRSLTVPGLFEIMAAPAMAPKKRMVRIWGRLLDSAQGIIKTVKEATAIK